MRTLVVTMMLIAAPLCFAGTGSVVGNGGDGYTDGNRVYVKDLWLAGAYTRPVNSKIVDPTLPYDCIKSSMRDIGMTSDFLPAELTQIDRVFPGLADVLIGVIASYRWTLVDEIFVLPNQETPYFDSKYPPPGPRIQLAIRAYGQIQISREWWSRMTAFDRAGLILHEAFTSLLPTTCLQEMCSQNQLFFRPTIGLFFNERDVAQALESGIARQILKEDLDSALGFDMSQLRMTGAESSDDVVVTAPGLRLTRTYYADHKKNLLDRRIVSIESEQQQPSFLKNPSLPEDSLQNALRRFRVTLVQQMLQ